MYKVHVYMHHIREVKGEVVCALLLGSSISSKSTSAGLSEFTKQFGLADSRGGVINLTLIILSEYFRLLNVLVCLLGMPMMSDTCLLKYFLCLCMWPELYHKAERI